MNLKNAFSRRNLLLLMTAAFLGMGVAARAEIAAKKAPNIKGAWVGTLSSELTGEIPFSLQITKQNKKTGKFSGSGEAMEQTARIAGTIKKSGKVTSTLKVNFQGTPITVKLNIQVDAQGTSGEGTFEASAQGQVMATGTVVLARPDVM